MVDTKKFSSTTTFCVKCGSILPLLQEFGSVKCYACKAIYDVENFNNIKYNYTIHFNTVSVLTNENILNLDNPEGPVVERKCPKCGCDRMSYATLQLRSADEGQTVFYTCVSCKYKETENS
ncbi:DNA-directed RNA polymerase I subunit RPA12 [Colias croceus]|uniref:DNA-directed RNA polymerase I subunit RPA12 n=1 Tax=Colias crocea TaxID=72248 RepID=UPI001E27A41C|nr:DNA-directed RNA polymerase I subunit RPA12 [Colias croceus]XP_045496456.1 DNA-directed RNA polymerase I subunit RPA12 [Colias croceus]XP_045496457.1 DNA-directed RNA polymerase I subunit RPA12 [Colias croceus]